MSNAHKNHMEVSLYKQLLQTYLKIFWRTLNDQQRADKLAIVESNSYILDRFVDKNVASEFRENFMLSYELCAKSYMCWIKALIKAISSDAVLQD